ncbi:MAG TPA: ribonuclease R, partial [Candidatus Acidoferrum sp.]|nr:ribonuclease R [Candidatus Acidoferrum sp.]
MNTMEEQILELLGRNDYAPSNVPELLHALGLPPNRQQDLQEVLRTLEHDGRVVRTKGNRYIEPREADLIPGKIRMNRGGKGFLQPDDPTIKEIAIPENATGTAFHEDRVLVRRDVRPQGLRSRGTPENTGSVIRILERKRAQFVGTLQRGRQFLYVIPDDPRISHDVYVPEPRDVGRPAHVGDKVVVELHEWESRHTNPEGEIIEVLGAPDEEGVDMLSVLRQYNMPLHFPKDALDEARAIGSEVRADETAARTDCRRHQVVTIDPDDAKDFDDAICLQRVSPDQWKLWVHIADVSHYVKPGTALDDEARRRGNSTYLVDRVIPMLPEALSNELCSLKPNVDRLTKCVEFLVSDEGRVLSTKFYSAVIHSQRRFSYQEVFAILQRKPAGPIEEMLHQAHELAQRIRRLRFKAGSLDLDFPEMKIRLDEQGRVERIEKVVNDVSHQLIEEYMLLANEAVATRLMGQNLAAIYRIHEEPAEKRLLEYREEVLSHNVPCGNLNNRNEVQRLLQKLNAIPIGQALKIGFLKSLMRARYAVEPLGHYGLAKKKYAHFTSPIRRYADLVVHRALFQSSHGSKHTLKLTADHISDTERNSADAERDSKDVKLFAFLNAQLKSGEPQRYAALVTDVRNMGFFVDVPGLSMSGLVPLSTMEDDFYVFDPARNHLIGRRTRRIIRLGDNVEVQIAKVNTFKKQVDFRLTQEKGSARPAPRGRGEPQRDDRRRIAPVPREQRPRQSEQRPRQSEQRPRQSEERPRQSEQRPRQSEQRPRQS